MTDRLDFPFRKSPQKSPSPGQPARASRSASAPPLSERSPRSLRRKEEGKKNRAHFQGWPPPKLAHKSTYSFLTFWSAQPWRAHLGPAPGHPLDPPWTTLDKRLSGSRTHILPTLPRYSQSASSPSFPLLIINLGWRSIFLIFAFLSLPVLLPLILQGYCYPSYKFQLLRYFFKIISATTYKHREEQGTADDPGHESEPTDIRHLGTATVSRIVHVLVQQVY